MYDLKIIEYNSPEYREMLLLRTMLLRTPLGLQFSDADLKKEINDLFIGCFFPEKNLLVGCCVLTPMDEHFVQLRQMAILKDFQRQGVGRQLIAFAEKEAVLSGFSEMVIHAREKAVPFYEKAGYQSQGAIFTEVTLPHLKMHKRLEKREKS